MLAHSRGALGLTDARFHQFRRLAGSFKALPELRRAVDPGELGWTKARVVAQVATAATQRAWLADAKRSSRRDLSARRRSPDRRAPRAARTIPPISSRSARPATAWRMAAASG